MAQRQLSSGERFVREEQTDANGDVTVLRGYTFENKHVESYNEREWVSSDVTITLANVR